MVATACPVVGAIELGISRPEIERAIRISRQEESERQRFHGKYIIRVGHPTVDTFEVITELRRVVLAAEERARLGDYLFDALDAERMLQPWRGRLSIVAHLRFNPQNALVTVPAYEMSLADQTSGRDIMPLDIKRTPIFANTTIIGADIEAVFDAAPLARARKTIVLQLPPSQIAAAGVDFASIE
jgi:hypothetical protein